MQFMGEMLKSARGIDIVMVSYKSVPDAAPDIISGRVEIWFAVVSIALPHAKSGKVRILAARCFRGFCGASRASAVSGPSGKCDQGGQGEHTR